MLDKPSLNEAQLIAYVRAAYGLPVTALTFLPVGADFYSAAYRADTETGQAYFLKVRLGNFDPASVTVPAHLTSLGIPHIMSPLPAQSGQFYTQLDSNQLILYPFVAGNNGWEVPLTDDEWRALGRTLKQIHAAQLPESIQAQVAHETFSPRWREQMADLLARFERETFADPIAQQLAAFINEKREVIRDLIARNKRLGLEVQRRAPHFVLCHSDLHLGNVMHNADEFYIVDWDSPMLAPREYDLKCLGGGWVSPRETELFYEGYGPGADRPALAFYCFQRILEDLSASCQNILVDGAGEENKAFELKITRGQFAPGGAVEAAYHLEAD